MAAKLDSTGRKSSSDSEVWIWRRKGVFEKQSSETEWIGSGRDAEAWTGPLGV